MRNNIAIPIFILLLSTACSPANSIGDNNKIDVMPTATSNSVIDVKIEITIDLSDKLRPVIKGETNLPDGTIIMTSIDSEISGVFRGQDETSVKNGSFVTKQYASKAGLPTGKYVASATMVVTMLQPKDVQAIIGKEGEYLKGDLIEKDGGQRSVYVEKVFEVGSSDEILKQATSVNNDILAVSKSVEDLINKGIEMESLRVPYNASACGNAMREYQAVLKENDAKILAMPKSLSVLYLGSANLNLNLCVSCLSNALDNCNLAKNDFAEFKKNYPN